jgi:hypothetical protein
MMRPNLVEFILEDELASRFDAIHCLGTGSWTREAVVLADLPKVRGIDTAMPFKFGLDYTLIGHTSEPYVPRAHDGDYFGANPDDEQVRLCIRHNVDTFLGWCAAPSFGAV